MKLFEALDTVLDRLIVPGYSRAGYTVRSLGWHGDPPALDGKVALVTGANSGLGKATAAGLARLGARVHMLVRSPERGESARSEVAARVPGADLHLEVCDVSRLSSVRAFARDFRARLPALHLLVHNAGVLPSQRTETEEGNELVFATHVLGPHLLTGLLTDLLRAGAPSRVIFVSSGGMYTQPLYVDDPQYTQGEYSGVTAYARTKRMQVVLAEQWAQQLARQSTGGQSTGESGGDGIAVHATHPGWAGTPGLAESLSGFQRLTGPLLRTPEQGADTFVWLAAADEPGMRTGLFWHDRRPRPTHYVPWTRESAEQRQRLWDTCQRLTSLES